jgi:hypothetical protein
VASVIPIAKAVYLCDDILPDPTRSKLTVVGSFNAVRLPADATFPYVLDKLCVFAQLVGGVGVVACRTEIIRAATNRAIYVSGHQRLTFPARHTTVTYLLRLRRFVFPAPGGYTVELFCEDKFVDDRLLHLIG